MTTAYRSFLLEPVNPATTDYTNGFGSDVTFSWTTSDLRHWLPARSFLLAEVRLTDASGDENKGVALHGFWPQRMANRWTHVVSGNLVQSSDKPTAINFALTTTKTSYAHNVTIDQVAFGGSGSLLDSDSNAETVFGVAIRPPLFLWYENAGIPGAKHDLTMSIPDSTELARRVYVIPTDLKASIVSLRLYVAMAHPQIEQPLPEIITYPLRNIAVYTTGNMLTGTELIETLTIPQSTYFIMVWLALASDSRLKPVQGRLKTVGIRFRGDNKPPTDYSNIFDFETVPTSTKDQIRAFVDTVSESRNLAPDFQPPNTFADWLNTPYYAFDMSFRAGMPDKELQVRGVHGESNPHKLVVACFHNSRLDLTTMDNKVVFANFTRDSV